MDRPSLIIYVLTHILCAYLFIRVSQYLTSQAGSHIYSLSVCRFRRSTAWYVLPRSAVCGKSHLQDATTVSPVPSFLHRAYATPTGCRSARSLCCRQNPLPMSPLLLSFRIPHSMIDVTHIHEPSSHTHLIVDDVLHDMCRLALTERQNSIPQTYVLIIILGQRTYVFPSFDVEPFGFFDKESILHIFR